MPCDWCKDSPAYEWKARIPAARIAEALTDKGVTQVDTIEPQGTGEDGYATTVLINGKVSVDANAFRLSVGPGELKSTRFTVQRDGADFVFAGRGYGHGVGLCQWGAYGLAKAGRGMAADPALLLLRRGAAGVGVGAGPPAASRQLTLLGDRSTVSPKASRPTRSMRIGRDCMPGTLAPVRGSVALQCSSSPRRAASTPPSASPSIEPTSIFRSSRRSILASGRRGSR